MYTTCVIWLAFVPLYFGTANHVALRITSMSVTISLSASVTVACLFSPKVSNHFLLLLYIIFLFEKLISLQFNYILRNINNTFSKFLSAVYYINPTRKKYTTKYDANEVFSN